MRPIVGDYALSPPNPASCGVSRFWANESGRDADLRQGRRTYLEDAMHRTTIGALLALVCALPIAADNVTLSWVNPTTWTDGTPLAPGDLKWANVYCGDAAGANYTSVASVDVSTGAHSYTLQLVGTTTCAVSFVAQVALTPSEVATGATNYPIESALSAPVTYAPARAPETSAVSGVVQGPTPMHCTTTTACTVDPPVAISAPRAP